MRTDWNERKWQYDVASFANMAALYNRVSFDSTKNRILSWMRDLQARWPHHKLGDMPQNDRKGEQL